MFVHPVPKRTVLVLVTTAVAVAAGFVPQRADAAVEVSVDSGVLLVKAEGSDLNLVDIRFDGVLYRVWDATPGLSAGDGCLVIDLGRAICLGEIGAATIRGSEGEDVIDLSGVPVPVEGSGGEGDDALNGGALQNTLTGGPGVDGLIGSAEDDRLDGGEGDDLLVGRDGKDVEFGGSEDDILQGGGGSGDTLTGDAGADLLLGGPGDDTLQGDSGADLLAGGSGDDSLSPGAGDDTVVRAGPGDDLQCSVPLDGTTGAAPPCAEMRSAPPPESWPPRDTADTGPTPGAAASPPNAVPMPPGDANYMKVKIRAERRHRITVCILPKDYRLHPLRRYTARTWTKYWTKVRRPRPPPPSWDAHARHGHC